jgi:hypothetical protein
MTLLRDERDVARADLMRPAELDEARFGSRSWSGTTSTSS